MFKHMWQILLLSVILSTVSCLFASETVWTEFEGSWRDSKEVAPLVDLDNSPEIFRFGLSDFPSVGFSLSSFKNPDLTDDSRSFQKDGDSWRKQLKELEKQEQTTSQEDEDIENTKPGTLRIIEVKGVKYNFRWCPAGFYSYEAEEYIGPPLDVVPSKYDPGDLSSRSNLCYNGFVVPFSYIRFDNPYIRKYLLKVVFSRGFWMLETEVTQKMWVSIMGNNPSKFKGDNRPVESISFKDMQVFVERLNANIRLEGGFKFAIPNSAEWEYACLTGKEKKPEKRKENPIEVGWYSGNSGGVTHDVGQKKANDWGLKDMLGNVSEGCFRVNIPSPLAEISNDSVIDPKGFSQEAPPGVFGDIIEQPWSLGSNYTLSGPFFSSPLDEDYFEECYYDFLDNDSQGRNGLRLILRR